MAPRWCAHFLLFIPKHKPQWRGSLVAPRCGVDGVAQTVGAMQAAMEGELGGPPVGSPFIVALIWGFAPPLRAVGLAAWLEHPLFGCQGA